MGLTRSFNNCGGDFDESGHLRGVLLRYRGSWIPYAPGSFDVEGFSEVIRGRKEVEVLSGVARVTEPFRDISGLPFRWENKRQTCCPLDLSRWAGSDGERGLPSYPSHDIEGCAGTGPVVRTNRGI